MTINKIEQAGSSKSRLLLVFEDGSKLRVRKETVADFGLYTGLSLSEEDLLKIREDSRLTGAKDRAVRIVSATNVSRETLRRKLVDKGESPDDAAQAVKWLSDLSLLDDRRSGEMIVRSAVLKGYGAARIRQILREKKIPQEYHEELLADLPPMDDAVDALLRQRLGGRDADRKEVQRAVDALLRRGHSWQDIKNGLDRYRSDVELEDPECQ